MAYFFFHGLGRQRQSAAAFLCFWLTLPGRWELGRREYCGAFKYSGRGRVQGGVLRGLLKKPAAMLWGCGVLVWRCMGRPWAGAKLWRPAGRFPKSERPGWGNAGKSGENMLYCTHILCKISETSVKKSENCKNRALEREDVSHALFDTIFNRLSNALPRAPERKARKQESKISKITSRIRKGAGYNGVP